MSERQTRKQRRKELKGNPNERNSTQNTLEIKTQIMPITKTQTEAFDLWDDGFHLMLHGIAGTGKTFLALYFALKEVLKKNSPYKKVVIVRSVVPTRDMGFLPGNQKEKTKVYEGPYDDICNKLFSAGGTYEYLKSRGMVEFTSTSFLRGMNLDNCIVVVDECQSMTFHELDTVITRLGEDTKLIFCGDINQNDLQYRKNDVSGLYEFMKILKKMDLFAFIEFTESDIVRSALVKQYIITKNRQGK